MERLTSRLIACIGLTGVIATFAAPSETSATGSFAVLYSFQGGPDGGSPDSPLVIDRAGNLYGTAAVGGDLNCRLGGGSGCGVLFKITPHGVESVIYAFHGKEDGAIPAGVIRDGVGNFFGTASNGGDPHCHDIHLTPGCGGVFAVDRNGRERLVYSFHGGTDGQYPAAPLARDQAGNLYGTTFHGGNQACRDSNAVGCGVVFKVTPDGHESVLHRFTGGTDGATPGFGSVVVDRAGNVYGTTLYGGNPRCVDSIHVGCGVIYEISTSGKQSVLYAFKGEGDGGGPFGGLFRDDAGNLFGTTYYGGDLPCSSEPGCGTVFEFKTSGQEIVLHRFFDGRDGAFPYAVAPARDVSGNLYGTTSQGGIPNCPQQGLDACGVMFKVTPGGQETVLYRFTDGNDGEAPFAGLVHDTSGTLYGTTSAGLSNFGAVFKLTL